jgi:methionyl aminopeptidase
MVKLLTELEILKLRRACTLTREVLDLTLLQVEAGISTLALDAISAKLMAERGVTSSTLGYYGFPGHICTSVNEVVCHGIPSPKVILKDGDIINIDITTHIDGFHGDTSRTVAVGEATLEMKEFVQFTEQAMWKGIDVVKPGGHIGDIGASIESFVNSAGFKVVRDYAGHGIGNEMHLDPMVTHFGEAGTGEPLLPGMAFTIEPMVNRISASVSVLDDDWTVVTDDGFPSAQFEHTILVTESGFDVLTLSV